MDTDTARGGGSTLNAGAKHGMRMHAHHRGCRGRKG